MFNNKFFITLTTILILFISCGNPMTDATDVKNDDNIDINTNNTNSVVLYYANKSTNVVLSNVTDEELKNLWLDIFANKKIYVDKEMTKQADGGRTDENSSYYEDKTYENKSPRSSFIKAGITKFKGEHYLCGVYWDNFFGGSGGFSSWRKIVITPDFAEHAYYGPATKKERIPDTTEDRLWFYYPTSPWGYVGD